MFNKLLLVEAGSKLATGNQYEPQAAGIAPLSDGLRIAPGTVAMDPGSLVLIAGFLQNIIQLVPLGMR